MNKPKTPHQIQTDDIDLDFSKFLQGISKRSKDKNHKEQILYLRTMFSALFKVYILESKEGLNESPPQTLRHVIVRQEINLFSIFLDKIREKLTDNDISQTEKHNLQ